jgi:hypothetical protein
MSAIESYRNIIHNPVINDDVKGFVNANTIKNFKKNTYKTVIPIGMGYRPDLVAEYFLGDSNLSWLITCVNNFTNGISDYKEGRSILIPTGE